MQVSSNMDGQLVLTRPESPVITIITTTSYNPSQSLTSAIHQSCNSIQQQQQLQQNIQQNVQQNLQQNMQQQNLQQKVQQQNLQQNVQQQFKCNSNEQQQKIRICRDFVRGSCRRLYCKYPHVQSPDQVVFCHDYQNNKCPRINCKFLHYSVEDEEHYRKFGEFSISQDDFQNQNTCGNVQKAEYSNEFSGFFNSSNLASSNRALPSILDGDLFQSRMDSCGMHCHSDRGFTNNDRVFRSGLKRMNNQDHDCMQQKFKRSREDDIMSVLRRFDEEHQMLKRRVEANELKIAELRASNEYLMTQNAQLRLSTVQVSRVVNPNTLTVTNTQSQMQGQGPQVINACMAPIQVATPIVSMAAPQISQQLIATPQNLNGQLIGTNSSQTTQQILGTSQITLGPGALAPSISTPSIGLSINTSQALQAAISNASQPIISYPIMTHSILPH